MKRWTLMDLEPLAHKLNKKFLDGESPDDLLEQTDVEINGFGVEGFEDNNGYWVAYVNMGDTYDTTIIWDEAVEEFHAGSWGDLVESDEERFGEDDE